MNAQNDVGGAGTQLSLAATDGQAHSSNLRLARRYYRVARRVAHAGGRHRCPHLDHASHLSRSMPRGHASQVSAAPAAPLCLAATPFNH